MDRPAPATILLMLYQRHTGLTHHGMKLAAKTPRLASTSGALKARFGPAARARRLPGSAASHAWYRSCPILAGSRRQASQTRYSPARSAYRSPLMAHPPGRAASGGLALAGAGPEAGRVPAGPPRFLRR